MWILFGNEVDIATASKFEFNGISVESYLSEIGPSSAGVIFVYPVFDEGIEVFKCRLVVFFEICFLKADNVWNCL